MGYRKINMRTQYAALNDLESVVLAISKLGKGNIVLLFDPKTGWYATDEVEVVKGKDGEQVIELRAKVYQDWVRPHVANAVSGLGAVRFLGESLMDKLFRKPIPIPVTPAPAAVASGVKAVVAEVQAAAANSAVSKNDPKKK